MKAVATVGGFPVPEHGGAAAAGLLADLLRLARDWEAGRMPLEVLRRQMTPSERYSARWAQRLDGSDDDALLRALFDALVRAERTERDGGRIVNRFGTWTQAEYHAGRFGNGRQR